VWKSKFDGVFVLNRRVVLHAIDATPARWRGDAGSLPLDGASTAASSPRNDLVKNYRVHPTHWLISTQALYYQGFAAQESGVWPSLSCVVLDSPYSDFTELAAHVASERKAVFGGFSLPKFVLDLLLASLDASVDARAGLRPTQHLSPVKHAPSCEAPALFVRARRDPLIAQEHVESLAKKYKGPRTLALVEGSHSSPRDVDARRFVARFLARHLPLPPIAKRPPSATAERHLQCAPWSRVRTEFATPSPKSRSRSMPPQSPSSLDSG